MSSVEGEQPRLVDQDTRLRDPLQPDRLLGERTAERDPSAQPPAHQLERDFRDPDQAHAVVNPARPQPGLGNFEAAALAQQDVGDRHPDVGEVDLGVPVGRVVVAKDGEGAQDTNPGSLARHEHHRLLPVPVRVGRIGLAHEDQDRAAWIHSAGGPPFAAIDDVGIRLVPDLTLDVGRVRRGDRRLGHGEPRADLAVEQRPQPLRLLRLRAEALEDLHVAGVGGRAVEDFGRPLHAAHDLAQRRVLQVAESGAFVRFGQEQVPQPGRARFRFELLDHRVGPPPVGRRGRIVVAALVRVDELVHEGAQLLPQRVHLR